ncbi:MAG: acyl-ACP--UDP-N-acetylglucosamine O-acyltransferase [Phycisphaerales bacterium]|nr:acyl-ACP--UDP-N-acetylglucosamine O-acyltransferase [Phycisphaerales bacterium]
MPTIHPSTLVSGEVDLADDVVIGPSCVLDGPIRIGPGTRLIGHVYLQGPLTLGAANVVYPFSTIGFAPQSVSYDPQKPGRGTVIGDRNTFRESVTIHRAMTDDGPTRIGNDNLLMVNAHVGHDGCIGDRCVFANCACTGGHVTIEDRVTIGGMTAIHQFVRIGHGAMLSGAVGLTMDLPPHFMLTGINVAGSINLIGLRRGGASREEIDDVRWVYRTLYRSGLTMPQALVCLRERAGRPKVAEYIRFMEVSKRGICHGNARRAKRNMIGDQSATADV